MALPFLGLQIQYSPKDQIQKHLCLAPGHQNGQLPVQHIPSEKLPQFCSPCNILKKLLLVHFHLIQFSQKEALPCADAKNTNLLEHSLRFQVFVAVKHPLQNPKAMNSVQKCCREKSPEKPQFYP